VISECGSRHLVWRTWKKFLVARWEWLSIFNYVASILQSVDIGLYTACVDFDGYAKRTEANWQFWDWEEIASRRHFVLCQRAVIAVTQEFTSTQVQCSPALECKECGAIDCDCDELHVLQWYAEIVIVCLGWTCEWIDNADYELLRLLRLLLRTHGHDPY
jgi:hypothetical protein